MPTKQETFDTVVAHLRRQGRQAKGENGCRYRAPNGDKCAAGCLIPDSIYDESMENKSVFTGGYELASPTAAGRAIDELGHDLGLVQNLQSIHDLCGEATFWEMRFEEVAKQHGLTYTPPAASKGEATCSIVIMDRWQAGLAKRVGQSAQTQGVW